MKLKVVKRDERKQLKFMCATLYFLSKYTPLAFMADFSFIGNAAQTF
jgi:hypothetical protein